VTAAVNMQPSLNRRCSGRKCELINRCFESESLWAYEMFESRPGLHINPLHAEIGNRPKPQPQCAVPECARVSDLALCMLLTYGNHCLRTRPTVYYSDLQGSTSHELLPRC